MMSDISYESNGTPKNVYKYLAKLTSSEDIRLFQLLSDCRRKLATETKREPYMIFDNRVLNLMAACKPTTKEQLITLPGIREVKYSQFGETFMNVIRAAGYQESDFVSVENFINPRWVEKQAEKPSYKTNSEKWDEIESRAIDLMEKGVKTEGELIIKLNQYAEMEKTKETVKYQKALWEIQERVDQIKLALKNIEYPDQKEEEKSGFDIF